MLFFSYSCFKLINYQHNEQDFGQAFFSMENKIIMIFLHYLIPFVLRILLNDNVYQPNTEAIKAC